MLDDRKRSMDISAEQEKSEKLQRARLERYAF